MQFALDQAAREQLTELRRRLTDQRSTDIGFPGAIDFDYSELWPLFGHLLNNVGDPFVDPVGGNHTKDLEREVLAFAARLFHAPPNDWWGYVTGNGSEGNFAALHLARTLHPRGLVYKSAAAHYSVDKAIELLAMDAVTVRTDDRGEVDYDDLRQLVSQYRHRPAIVVANIGTTMTEAVDDVLRISGVLNELPVPGRYIHSDAALAGIPLALLADRPGFDLADGADSISVSGHKFVGAPFPCGLLVARRSLRERIGRAVAYTGSPDTTISGSRNGHAALLLWYAIRRFGVSGLRQRAEYARALAEYTAERLIAIGWPAWRHPHAFTVVLRTPPQQVTSRWTLATENGWSHVICMPGVTRHQIDAFVGDLLAAAEQGSVPADNRWSGPGAQPVAIADELIADELTASRPPTLSTVASRRSIPG